MEISKINIIIKLKNNLKKNFGEFIEDVVLFGSQTTGKAHKDSDYDVLIVVNSSYDWKFRKRIIHTVYDLELEFDVILDIHLISKYEINNTLKGSEPIYQNALKEGLYV